VLRRLGLRIRQLREAAALTLDRASSAAGIDLSHWQRIEAAPKNATVGTLVKVASVLRVEVGELFVSRSKEPQRPRRQLDCVPSAPSSLTSHFYDRHLRAHDR
jgi:transcriptional regulator with XRE-family HTH domain